MSRKTKPTILAATTGNLGNDEFARFPEVLIERGVGRTAAYDLRKRGLIDTFTIGRARFVKLDSLRELPAKLAALHAA